jgi:hypothetical protein
MASQKNDQCRRRISPLKRFRRTQIMRNGMESRRDPMRRPLSLVLAAALAAGATSVGVAPSMAASLQLPPLVAASAGGIVRVGGGDHSENDALNRYRIQHNDNPYYYRHHRRDDAFPPFFFDLPFAYAPQYYRPYRDCYRARNGVLYCRY